MKGLNPNLVENLAQSISWHAAGQTYSRGHLDDFGKGTTRLDLVERIRAVFDNPNVEFLLNTSDDSLRGGTLYLFDRDNKSVLIFNPNQLADPNGTISDNLAGTFYRAPKINEDGLPVNYKGKVLTTDAQVEKNFREEIKRHIRDIADATGMKRENVMPQRISESDDWAKHIQKYEKDIAEGLEKALLRVMEKKADFEQKIVRLKLAGKPKKIDMVRGGPANDVVCAHPTIMQGRVTDKLERAEMSEAYARLALAFDRMVQGEALDPVEREEVLSILSGPDKSVHLIGLLEARYPEQLKALIAVDAPPEKKQGAELESHSEADFTSEIASGS